MRHWQTRGLVGLVVMALLAPAAWADTVTTKTPQKVIVQNAPTADGDTGGGTQTVTLFGLALPASGGVVFGGTATNPFIVSGTVAATQSGTWTVQPGNTANTTPWLFTIHQGGNAAAVNGSGQLSVTCANCSGSGASAVDDAAFTPGTDSGAPAMGMFDDVSPDSVNEGDVGVLRMSANRNAYSTIRDAAGNERGANVNASNELLTNANTELPAAAGAPSAGAAPTAPAVWSYLVCQDFGASTYSPCQASPNIAHDAAAAAAAPLLLGGYASAAAPSDVSADNDAVRAWFLRNGAQAIQSTFAGVLATTGAGNTGTGVQRVIEATDSQLSAGVGATGDAAATAGSTGSLNAKARLMTTQLDAIQTAVQLIDNAISGAGFNITQLGGVNVAMNTGTRSAGTLRVTVATDDIVPASQSGTWTVQPGNTANTTPWLVSSIPATSGGTTPCYITSAASTNATNCKASAGQLYSVEAVNTTATLYYLRLYNLASAPTCSSATGFVRTIPVPPYAAAGGAGGIVIDKATGEAYGTGVGFCLTGGGSSTDNTNAATGVYVTLNYK